MNFLKKLVRTYINELFGLLIYFIISIALLFVNRSVGLLMLFCFVIYAAFIAIRIHISKHRMIGERDATKLIPEFFNIVSSPALIVDENNKIVWCNNSFKSLPEVIHTIPDITKVFDGALSHASLSNAISENIDTLPLSTEASYYEIKIYPIPHKNMYGAVLSCKDEEKNLSKALDDSAARVAYIVIDNTNEVSQEIQENNRFGAAKVNKLLEEWATKYSAILIEYERDKYFMQFENVHLKSMISSKFDILDQVFAETSTDSYVPITISIGVSSGKGTLSEKRESAMIALRSALQRGGALAVVRTDDGEDSYGGRNKAVQRQTKIRSRLCKDFLSRHLKDCESVIIMGHQRPDFDSIASNIGIATFVKTHKVPYYIVADKNDKNISKIIENISCFPEYDSVFIDEPRAQEILESKDSLVIITDASNPELFAAPKVFDKASKVVIIDHHAIKEPLTEYKQVLHTNIDPTASSASELICEILELSMNTINSNSDILKLELRTEEAQILLAGILLDTQFFSRDTGTRTYSACSFLKNAGADVGKAKNLFKSDLEQFRAISDIEQNMHVYRDKFAISIYNSNTNPENKVIASKAADNMVDIEGISASFVLYSLENGINLSARSDGTVNVINIAKLLGGGGHFQSAGAQIKKRKGEEFTEAIYDVFEALEILKEAIDEYIGDSTTKEGKNV